MPTCITSSIQEILYLNKLTMRLITIKQYMQITPNDQQNIKNRHRLIQQNIKLHRQLTEIQNNVSQFVQQQNSLQPPQLSYLHLLSEIATQQKLIKKLRSRIEQFNLQRAKDNVEYIVREEDELKISKKYLIHLVDEKQVYIRKKQDKSKVLKNDVPYQQYQSKFLRQLMKVVHHNRDQATQITEIERQIRKYHLLRKMQQSQTQNSSKTKSDLLSDLEKIQNQIKEKQQARKNLQKEWKPHLKQLDDDHAKLIHQLALKKSIIAEIEKQERAWDTRMLATRNVQDITKDKKRVKRLAVSDTLKLKLKQSIQKQGKKQKKVNLEALKYTFIPTEPEKPINQENNTFGKKKPQKIIETTHNDKNISKKIDKKIQSKNSNKTDQISNTNLSFEIKKQIKKFSSEDQSLKLWKPEDQSSVQPKKQTKVQIKQSKQPNKDTIYLSDIGMTVDIPLEMDIAIQQ